MQFSRIISSVDLQIWTASSNAFSFVTTESIGTNTFCGARGKVTVRESTSGNITTVYDARGCRNIGRHHEPLRRSSMRLCSAPWTASTS